jgi:hypothetical protein
MAKKPPVGAITRVNMELLAEVKQQAAKALIIAREYGLPVLDALLVASGVPGPFAALAGATIKFAVDDIAKNNTENAEVRASTFQSCVAHSQQNSGAYKSVTPERLRFLYQRLTRKAVEIRQEDRIRVVVAATLGGSDADIASPDDLFAAEWLEEAPESKLRVLVDFCGELFGTETISEIREKPDDGAMDYPSPCKTLPTDNWISRWYPRTRWWSHPNIRDEMFLSVNTLQEFNPGSVAAKDVAKPRTQYTGWPSPLLQRVHNAFVRSKQMMEFDLKQAAETAKPSKA